MYENASRVFFLISYDYTFFERLILLEVVLLNVVIDVIARGANV
jgi:hypothetical protein